MELLVLAVSIRLLIVLCLVIVFRRQQNCRSTAEFFRSFSRDKSGQDLIEYALMAGFIAVAAGAIVPGVTEAVKNIFTDVNRMMASAPLAGAVATIPPASSASGLTGTDIVRLICALLAVVFLGIIIMRRKNQPEE